MGRCESCKKLTTQKGITFHRFPTNENERKKWTENMGNPNWVPAKTTVLCSEHFSGDCFERWWNITRLRKGSVLTVFQQDTSLAHKNSDKDQIPRKKAEVNTSTPPTEDSTSLPPNLSSCAQTTSSVEGKLHPINPQISVPSHSTSTPKSPTCRNQLTPKTLRPKEIVTHDHHYEDTPRTSYKKLISLRQKYARSQKIVKALQGKVKNLKTTVYSLQQVVSILTKKIMVCESVSYVLSTFSNTPLSLFTRMLKNHKSGKLTREQYPPQLRCFALTLHFYSPKAYKFVRKTFKLALPHPDVIRTWYASIDAEPDFVEDCFSTLKYRVAYPT